MGSGKSSVGQLLAGRLGYKFLDSDAEIVKKEKRPIARIFAEDREKYFRKLETEFLKNMLEKKNLVLATGGGIILKAGNVKLLRKMGPVIYLKVSPEAVLQRLAGDNSRPLLSGPGRLQKAKGILRARREQYLSSADLVINTDNLSPFQIVEKIVKYLHHECR